VPGERTIVQVFVDALDGDAREQAARTSALGMVLHELVSGARAAWPGVGVDPAVFVAYVAERLPGHGEVVAELRAVRGDELYLACACAAGDSGAIAKFDTVYAPVVHAALARMNIAASTRDEVSQLVRHKLFVAEDGQPPRIADFAGRGDLRNWVRAAAVRTCLNLLRKHKREVVLDDERMLAAFPAAEDDPELAHMKATYSAEFKQAFIDALRALADRPKNLLYHYYVDELTIDQIGAIYRVHRVTAFRWVNRAREQLVDATHANLRQRLHVTSGEMDSILRLIRSELDMSIARYLKD
jgi:RNA polymerase sigma-70 factor (ECF subfamily)